MRTGDATAGLLRARRGSEPEVQKPKQSASAKIILNRVTPSLHTSVTASDILPAFSWLSSAPSLPKQWGSFGWLVSCSKGVERAEIGLIRVPPWDPAVPRVQTTTETMRFLGSSGFRYEWSSREIQHHGSVKSLRRDRLLERCYRLSTAAYGRCAPAYLELS